MTNFRFLHAADIHLDSPLHGLSRYEGLPEADIRGATRMAFDNMVQRAIDEAVNFVIIAGDLFDGAWKDMGTGLYFAKAMGRLDQAGIPVFLLAGNHDAASVITRSIPWPPNVRRFHAKKPQTYRLDEIGVSVSGQSFPTPEVTDNLARGYPDPTPHYFNIGVLHTALAGREGHEAYAPCSLDELRSRRYDYWALGHVHAYELVSEAPYVVFPGNLQGRNIRETGAKGAVLVTVEDRQVTAVERVELDVLRWARVEVDCTGRMIDDVPDLIRAALITQWQGNPGGLPLIARLSLVGRVADAGAFYDRAGALRDDARAVASSISPDLFIEKVKLHVSAIPPARDVTVSDDLADLIDQSAASPSLAEALAEELKPFLLATETLLGPPEDEDLRRLASAGDWQAILSTAALALQARLMRRS